MRIDHVFLSRVLENSPIIKSQQKSTQLPPQQRIEVLSSVDARVAMLFWGPSFISNYRPDTPFPHALIGLGSALASRRIFQSQSQATNFINQVVNSQRQVGEIEID